MSDIVIQVEGLSKQYRLGEVSTGSLHHDINRWWHRIRGKEDPYLSITGENIRTGKAEKNNSQNSNNSRLNDYVWALRDINFEVRRGEVLGIIGRNGAGKSTLLKILSRITAPTTGEVRIKGRIGALLEVGTGFHQDLTGRENIDLNGAILGMTRVEIASKLDEIVDFSGCAAYLDTPVKRYSSGMVVRLAFAVAAHLDPEILVVDEVLAVGDAEFQRKCIGKMSEVASEGRTVLFVSHNLAAVQNLCHSAIWLNNGIVAYDKSDVEKVVSAYEQSGRQESGTVLFQAHHHRVKSDLQITAMELRNSEGHSATQLKYGEAIRFHFRISCREAVSGGRLGIAVRSNGLILTTLQSPRFDFPDSEKIEIECSLPGGVLLPGTFEISVGVTRSESNAGLDYIQEASAFFVSDIGLNRDWVFDRRKAGIVTLASEWRFDA